MRIVKTYITGKPPHPSVLLPVFIWSLLVALSYVFWNDIGGWASSLPVSKFALFEKGEYWRAFTALFIHGDLEHLLANTLFFLVFGYLTHAYFGHVLFPLVTGLGAALTNVITVSYYPLNTQLVGASGWVYLLAGTWLTLFVLIERRLTVTSRTLRFFAVSLVLLVPETFKEEVSYLAHGVGFGAGVVIGLIYFYLKKSWLRSHEVIRIDPPEDLEPETTGFEDHYGHTKDPDLS